MADPVSQPPQGGTMPPGGSPTAMPTQGQDQGQGQTMPPEQAIQIMQKFGISQKDLPEIQAAMEALEAAGMIQEGPEDEGQGQQGPPGGDANSRIAQMLSQ